MSKQQRAAQAHGHCTHKVLWSEAPKQKHQCSADHGTSILAIPRGSQGNGCAGQGPKSSHLHFLTCTLSLAFFSVTRGSQHSKRTAWHHRTVLRASPSPGLSSPLFPLLPVRKCLLVQNTTLRGAEVPMLLNQRRGGPCPGAVCSELQPPSTHPTTGNPPETTHTPGPWWSALNFRGNCLLESMFYKAGQDAGLGLKKKKKQGRTSSHCFHLASATLERLSGWLHSRDAQLCARAGLLDQTGKRCCPGTS